MGRWVGVCAVFLMLFFVRADGAERSLKNKFASGRVGDFVVIEQNKTYSLLFIRELSEKTIVLEELSSPEEFIDSKTIKWQEWIDKGAPGHTSWTLYEIELSSGKVAECYSLSQKGWLDLGDSGQFFARLLSLSFHPLTKEERKKIGPQPPSGEPDRRSVWNPALIISGKKTSRPEFEVWKTSWPKDGSLLSNCPIELFFNQNNPHFPFPYWIEIQTSHYAFRLRAVDSGYHLLSSFSGDLPRRRTAKFSHEMP